MENQSDVFRMDLEGLPKDESGFLTEEGKVELARIRAKRGATLLDQQGPEISGVWRETIIENLEYFAISDPYACVCGLVFGDYTTGVSELGLMGEGEETPTGLGVINHGFEADGEVRYVDLTAAWKEIIGV